MVWQGYISFMNMVKAGNVAGNKEGRERTQRLRHCVACPQLFFCLVRLSLSQCLIMWTMHTPHQLVCLITFESHILSDRFTRFPCMKTRCT